MKPEFISLIIKVSREYGYDPMPYSGRGMYGKTCLGISVARGLCSFNVCAGIAREANYCLNQDDFRDFMDDLSILEPREDSLGMGSVVYFPNIPWADSDKELSKEDNFTNNSIDLEG